MSRITVNYAGLENGRQGLMTIAAEIDAKLDALRAELNALDWAGEAGQAYAQLQSRWDEAATELARVLAQMAEVLDQVADNYRSAESSAANSFE